MVQGRPARTNALAIFEQPLENTPCSPHTTGPARRAVIPGIHAGASLKRPVGTVKGFSGLSLLRLLRNACKASAVIPGVSPGPFEVSVILVFAVDHASNPVENDSMLDVGRVRPTYKKCRNQNNS